MDEGGGILVCVMMDTARVMRPQGLKVGEAGTGYGLVSIEGVTTDASLS